MIHWEETKMSDTRITNTVLVVDDAPEKDKPDEFDETKGLEIGAVDYITKPASRT